MLESSGAVLESSAPIKAGDLIIVPKKSPAGPNILSGRFLPWATFVVSLGLILAFLI